MKLAVASHMYETKTKSMLNLLLLPALAVALAAVAVSPALGQDAGEDYVIISPMAVGSLQDGQGAFDRLGSPADIEMFVISNRTYALAASALGTQILDITDPGLPAPVANIRSDRDGLHYWGDRDSVGTFAVSGNTYAILGGNTLRIINLTTPDTPQIVATVRSGQDNFYALRHLSPERTDEILAGYPGARDLSYLWEQISDIETFVAVSGQTYVLLSSVDRDAVQIIDVTSPQIPVLVASIHDGLDGFYALSQPQDAETFTTDGRTYAVVAGQGDNAVQIIDITEPGAPVPAASIRQGQNGLDSMAYPTSIEIFVADGRIYALVSGPGERAAQIIDVTDPLSPAPVAPVGDGQDWFAVTGRPEATFAADGRTYALLVDSYALRVIDVTDPHSSAAIATILGDDGAYWYYPPYLDDVDVFTTSGGTYALVSGFGDALTIIDITDPAAPERLSSVRGGLLNLPFTTGSAEMKMFTVSDRTYALLPGSGDDALQIINITDPATPQRVASIRNGQDGFIGLSHPLDMEMLTISGKTYALVADSLYGTVQILNVTDPTTPLLVTGIWDGAGGISIFDTSDRTYAMVMSGSTLQVINITDPTTSLTISGAQVSGRFHLGLGGSISLGVITVDGQTYAMTPPTHREEVLIVNITDAESPEFLDPVSLELPRFFSIFSDPTDMELFTAHGRTYALVSGYSDFDPVGTLQIIDITRPHAPVLLATVLDGQDGFDMFRMPVDVEVFVADGRTYALVVNYGFGSEGSVYVVDMTDPADPLPVTTLRGGQDGFDAMDNPVDIGAFVIDGATYALVSNPDSSVLQVISLTGQSTAP